MFKHPLTFLVVFFTLASCATVDAPMQSVEAPVSRDVQIQAQREQVTGQVLVIETKGCSISKKVITATKLGASGLVIVVPAAVNKTDKFYPSIRC